MSSHVDALAMATAMYAGFVVLFPLSSSAHDMSLMMPGHMLAPLFMLGAMLLRRRDYVAHR
jgi:hypothetical protein